MSDQQGSGLPVTTEEASDPMHLAAVMECGDNLRYVPLHLITVEICLAAVKQSGRSIHHVPPGRRTHGILLAAVEQDFDVFRSLLKEQMSPEICMAAVRQSGLLLSYVPDELKTSELCMAAVTNKGWSIKYVPDALRSEDVCIAAIASELGAIHHLDANHLSPKAHLEILRYGAISLDFLSGSQISLALSELEPGQPGDDFIDSLEKSMNRESHRNVSDVLAVIHSAKIARSMNTTIKSCALSIQSSDHGIGHSLKRRRANV